MGIFLFTSNNSNNFYQEHIIVLTTFENLVFIQVINIYNLKPALKHQL